MAAPIADSSNSSNGGPQQLLAEPLATPAREKPFDPGAYALRKEYWSIFALLSAISVLLALFSLCYAYIASSVPKLWQGEDYENALKDLDLGKAAKAGKWWYILVGTATGLTTAIIRIVTDYPMDVHGLMQHLATQHCDWKDSWKTSLLTLVSQLGGTSLGLEAGVAAAGTGFTQYIAERMEFDHTVQRVCFTSSLSSVFGALFPMPVIAPLMIAEGAAAPAPGTKMALFAINSLSSLVGFFVYVGVMGYPYLASVENPTPLSDENQLPIFFFTLLIGALSAGVVLMIGTLVHFFTHLTRTARKSMSPRVGHLVLCTLGGVMYGTIAWGFPLTMGTGHELIKPAVLHPDKIGTWVLFGSLIAKMCAFATLQACGFEGGPLFCPITLGVFLGVFVQSLAASFGIHHDARLFAAAGMSSMSGAGGTPFTNVVMTLFLLQLSGHFTWVPLLAAVVGHVLLVGGGMLRWAQMANPFKAQLM